MVIYHIDTVILHSDMEYGLMIWEMTVSIRSFPISIWDILSLWGCQRFPALGGVAQVAATILREALQ